MEGYTIPEVDESALVAAVDAEAAFPRSFLPNEPYWDAIVQDKARFAAAVRRDLQRGRVWPAGHVVDVRKPGHGIRPVAILAPEARVLYRALAEACVPLARRPDRSSEAYAAFVIAPMIGAFSRLPPGLRKVRESRFSHVVISDVAAFYQYVDHELLRSELDLIDAPIRAADALLDLLGELHQRTFGLPQRSEPSDWLSEIYATRIDRWLLRRGLEHWRHNDDFRVGCETYGDALRAIEVLAAASRDSGLVLNDEKTAVPRFLTYVMNHSNVDVNATSDEIDPSDVEAAVTTEYAPDEDDQARDEAREVVDRLFVRGHSSPRATPPIDLTELSHDHHRAVRRAINTLARLEDDHAVPVLLDLLAYQPAMTHLVVRYAQTVAAARPDVVDVLDSAMTKLSLTDWQRAWIAYGYRACGAEIHGSRQERLTTLVARDPSSYSAAEAVVTLARNGSIEYALVEDQIRRVPTALVPWYLVAAKELKANSTATQAAIAALQAVSPTARSLLS